MKLQRIITASVLVAALILVWGYLAQREAVLTRAENATRAYRSALCFGSPLQAQLREMEWEDAMREARQTFGWSDPAVEELHGIIFNTWIRCGFGGGE